MIDPRFAILGALITVTGSAFYTRDTLRGRTQPNRVSWLMWTLAPLIAFAAEVFNHVGLAALLTLAVGLGPLLVVIASFADPHAFARVTRLDVVCGGLSLAALVGWGLSGSGDLAIAFAIASDLLGAAPTLRKAFTHPESESASAFASSATGAVITLLTVPAGAWDVGHVAFPLYILAIDVTLCALILGPRRASQRRADTVSLKPGSRVH